MNVEIAYNCACITNLSIQVNPVERIEWIGTILFHPTNNGRMVFSGSYNAISEILLKSNFTFISLDKFGVITRCK